jgi:transcriptional regulator with XRE-family HTH domain
MTGSSVRSLRTRLALSQLDLSRVLLVNDCAVYRWERAAADEVHASPLHALILDALEASTSGRSEEERRAFGKMLARATLHGGAVAALALLLADSLGAHSAVTTLRSRVLLGRHARSA